MKIACTECNALLFLRHAVIRRDVINLSSDRFFAPVGVKCEIDKILVTFYRFAVDVLSRVHSIRYDTSE